MLPPVCIIEPVLHVDDGQRAHDFHETAIGLEHALKSETLQAYDAGGWNVRLRFGRGASVSPQRLYGGSSPPHDGTGLLHLCVGTTENDPPAWEPKRTSRGIPVDGCVA